MPAVSIPQAFALALQHHQAGRLAEAEALYRQILAAEPQHAAALHHVGVIAHQLGRYDLAVEWIHRSLAATPGSASAYCDLGEAYRAMDRVDDAIGAYRAAIEVDPNCAEAHANLGVVFSRQRLFHEAKAACRRALTLKPESAIFHFNLGNVLRDLGEGEEAIASFRGALRLQPDFAIAENNLGNVLKQMDRLDEAIVHFQRAVELKPDHASAWFNLGNGFMAQGRPGDAIATFRRAAHFKPNEPEIWNNLGGSLLEHGQPGEAADVYRRVLQLKPDYAEAHGNLGKTLGRLRQFDEAIASCRRALELKPELSPASIVLGNALKEEGRLDEALVAYRRALDLNPEDAVAHSNVIYALHFHPGCDQAAIGEEQRRWNRRLSVPGKSSPLLYPNEPLPERRLRVGYVSPEFRDHVTGRYLRPLFQHHGRLDFEILCYSGVNQPDHLTEEFRHVSDGWRDIKGMADAAVAEVIRQDGLDILVDLTQHLAENRLPVFTHRPAPIQVSFAGYPASTGVEAISRRISDRYLESKIEDRSSESGTDLPSPISDLRTAEQVFLIDSFWCFDPCGTEVEVNPLPALEKGRVTFGCLNNFCKINEPVLRLWARVLGQVEKARLILLSPVGSHREQALEVFSREGIDARRAEFVVQRPRQTYLESYHRVDIALDPFPYNGHTTSLEALWMGVPVISMAGDGPVSRAGWSQLSNLGLPELVAFSEDDYVRIASRWAGDLPRLAQLRRTLRSRMEASVLMDARHFARSVEMVYRTLWQRWCKEKES